MNYSKIFASFVGVFLLFNSMSCGSSNMVTITILPSVGFQPKKFHFLNEEFFQQGPSLSFTNVLNASNSCRQMNVRTAMAVDSQGDNINTYVVSGMRTAMPSPTPFTTTWLNTPGNVEFETPLKVDVAKGVAVEIGFFAILNRPGDVSPVDGVCDNVVSGIAEPSYLLFGHKAIGSPTTSITVPMNIFMVNTTPVPTPIPPVLDAYNNPIATVGMSGGYMCSNPNDFNLCPVRDLLEIKMTPPGSGFPCKIKRIRYFSGTNGTAPLDNLINDYSVPPSTTSHFYVTHSNSYEITVYNTNTLSEATVIGGENSTFNTANANLPGVCVSTQSIKIGKIGTL